MLAWAGIVSTPLVAVTRVANVRFTPPSLGTLVIHKSSGARLSSMVQMTPEEFATKYGYLVAREAAPMSMVSRMPPPPPKPSFSD